MIVSPVCVLCLVCAFIVLAQAERSTRKQSCLLGSPLIFQDEHDGDRKAVTLKGNELTILPFGSKDRWNVRAKIDPRFCNASVDFNVPGKPNPPPINLTATIWTESRRLPNRTVYKNAIEFTDPSGTLALPSVPLNTWVQVARPGISARQNTPSQPLADSPKGYTCFEQTDIAGRSCDLTPRRPATSNLTALADECDKAHDQGCRGFNSNGYLKRCVRASCGADIKHLTGHKNLVSCLRTDTPTNQPVPSGCSSPPKPPAPPTPGPTPGKPVFNCSITAARPDCNCSGAHPPFSAPAKPIPRLDDYHYPKEEQAQHLHATLTMPRLVRTINGNQGNFLDPSTGKTFTLTLGGGTGPHGWFLADVTADSVVIEILFDAWGMLAYLSAGASSPSRTIRKPVGRLQGIRQPLYAFDKVDSDFKCKQDIDPTDFLATCASDMSGSEEIDIQAAISVLEPNPDSALFGNPEELNKWSLSSDGTVGSWPWPPAHEKIGPQRVWSVKNYLPPSCASGYRGSWPESKMGMLGRFLRAVDQGLWSNASSGGCGVEVLAVAAPMTAANATSVALLRVHVLDTRSNDTALANITYVQITVDQNTSKLVSVKELADGHAFYDALAAHDERWTHKWKPSGAQPKLPISDQRYADTAAALLTMYMNLDRGLVPQYGGGKFWNVYNTFLPLDTLALNGALLEWNYVSNAQEYLSYFFQTKVNATSGKIIYSIFGCDSDADYGRLISTFVRAVGYGGDLIWARGLLPIIHAMARGMLAKRSAALAAFPKGSPLHGIVTGSPEHDICGGPGYFFSVNVWHVRGLDDLGRLHEEYPSLSIDPALQKQLRPTAAAWREDIRFAANFTAVRRSDGEGIFFLSPVVGSAYGHTAGTPKGQPLLVGGDEGSCVSRGTCFASMTASTYSGGSNQQTNYANFRIFSETLLAGVLDPEYEAGMINFRRTHRGTLLGMTRFRDGLDDMPILGYGRATIRHDLTAAFHATLSGHTLNYLTRGTHWGTEQRQQISWSPSPADQGRYRNDCGVGGEDCSLCMVSSVASSYWVRWMLVTADDDQPVVYVARGAPRRWYNKSSQPFGITNAPTRLAAVSYSIAAAPSLSGWVALSPNHALGTVHAERVAVRLRAEDTTHPIVSVRVSAGDAELIAWHKSNETAVFRLRKDMNFSFEAS